MLQPADRISSTHDPSPSQRSTESYCAEEACEDQSQARSSGVRQLAAALFRPAYWPCCAELTPVREQARRLRAAASCRTPELRRSPGGYTVGPRAGCSPTKSAGRYAPTTWWLGFSQELSVNRQASQAHSRGRKDGVGHSGSQRRNAGLAHAAGLFGARHDVDFDVRRLIDA